MLALLIVGGVIAGFISFWVAYLVLIPLLGLLVGKDRRPPLPDRQSLVPGVTVLVPAHNMSDYIERCIRSLRGSDYPSDHLNILVVADHCTDNTAALAEANGATVFTRDKGPAGKTYTLGWTIDTLVSEGALPDVLVVVDATCTVDPEFLSALVDLWRTGETIIVSHPVVDPRNQKWFARCLGLTLVHRNLQNRARQRLELSALIEGRGMAYDRGYLERHQWHLALPPSDRSTTHPTEDWRHGVRAVEEGYRVAFADDARILTPLRGTLAAATQQGARWERGRMSNAATHALSLLRQGLTGRNLTKISAGLDAVQLPVAILGALALVFVLASTLILGESGVTFVGAIALGVFTLYGITVVVAGRADGIHPLTVLWAPVYVAWRCLSFVLAWDFFDRRRFSRRKP